MPLQIDEISVSMQVVGEGPTTVDLSAGRSLGRGRGPSEAEREALVIDIVRRVLEVLRAREER